MIELGLNRIVRLLKDNPIPWRAIHVAGTNGKGSVCSYASAMLTAGNIHCGRFTSPHLIDRWDCISIDDRVVDSSLFRRAEEAVHFRNQRDNVKASEFELLTATAFEVFNLAKIEVGIVEVGLGGRHDATNVLQDPLVTVITKIGEDHQALLGNSLGEIAYQKAGIMKQNSPCVADGSNAPSVIQVLQKEAKTSQATSLLFVQQDTHSQPIELQELFDEGGLQLHQRMNIALAYEAVKVVIATLDLSLDPKTLVSAVRDASWPGRLQTIDLYATLGQAKLVLLDGAHNAQSAQVLGHYVDEHLRQSCNPATWIISVSQGKDVREILNNLLKPGDNVIAESFGPVDGMPWVQPAQRQDIKAAASDISNEINVVERSESLKDTICNAVDIAAEGSIIIAGSLYLVSDVLRLMRDAKQR